jgi:hypothetical protein
LGYILSHYFFFVRQAYLWYDPRETSGYFPTSPPEDAPLVLQDRELFDRAQKIHDRLVIAIKTTSRDIELQEKLRDMVVSANEQCEVQFSEGSRADILNETYTREQGWMCTADDIGIAARDTCRELLQEVEQIRRDGESGIIRALRDEDEPLARAFSLGHLVDEGVHPPDICGQMFSFAPPGPYYGPDKWFEHTEVAPSERWHGEVRQDWKSLGLPTEALSAAIGKRRTAVSLVKAIVEAARRGLAELVVRPTWDGVELLVGATCVRKYKGIAENQRAVLDAFEQAGWPRRITNPFSSREGRKGLLRNTLRDIRSGIAPRLINFHAVDGADGVTWELLSGDRRDE